MRLCGFAEKFALPRPSRGLRPDHHNLIHDATLGPSKWPYLRAEPLCILAEPTGPAPVSRGYPYTVSLGRGVFQLLEGG
jgi:hypothetical protein